VKPICGSEGVGDSTIDTGFISRVHPQPIATRFVLNIDLSFVEPEFMLEYEATFGEERAEDSADDQPIPDLSKRDKILLQRALDGLRFDDSVTLINHNNVIIQNGIIFKTMEVMKIWLAEYAVFHHCPLMIKHSDVNKRYVLTCCRGCPYTVRTRKGKDDSWKITSVV
jgi:hypothetical protein